MKTNDGSLLQISFTNSIEWTVFAQEKFKTLGDLDNPLVGHLQNQHKRFDAQRFRSLRMEFYQKPLFLELGIHLGRTHKQSNLPLQNEGQNLHLNRDHDLFQCDDRAHSHAPNT